MKLSNILTQYKQTLKQIPRKYWVIGGVLLAVLIYSLIFFIPKKVDFSYAGQTCTRQLLLFPSIQQLTSDEFDLEIKDELKIGSFAYASTVLCASPKDAPVAGNYGASIRPFGTVVMAKQLSIKVSEAPLARESDIVGKTISTALPLKIELTSPDTVHTYKLAVEGKEADCNAESSKLLCPTSKLGLNPGADYTASLLRSFNGKSETKLIEGEVETLLPIKLTEGSVADGATIYDTPKAFTFSFDKPIEDVTLQFIQKQEQTDKTIKITPTFDGNKVVVPLATELERKAQFTLTLEQVVADDGSALESPMVLNFSTSGGPKPNNVSVGSSNVAQNAQIVVTFDQPIKEDVDIAQFARVEGVNGSVAQRSETQLVFSIQAGLCQGFKLVLDKGIASGSNSATSEPWSFESRTICGTSAIIGYSVEGRPIVAYYFGNGSETILFTGGIHGEERSAQQTMQAWADYLMVYGYRIPADKRVVVVPNLNPDGIVRGVRNNVNNVNLGRNYPTANWKASIDTASGQLPTGGGTEPGSEPETKAIMALTSQLRPRLQISFHAQGSLVGANKVADSIAIGTTYASTVGYGTMFYNAEEVMGYSITGEYEEWMGEQFGIPAILIELPSRQGNYLNSQLTAIMKMLSV